MHEIDIAQTDLNLLVVLDILLQERSVTRAARRLGRTQSATSHALGRLREQLGDPLLVRVGGQMRPTPRALALGPELSRLLGALSRALGESSDAFDPATSERTFTLVAPDFVSLALPSMLARMEREAPRCRVELLGPRPQMFRDVADGRYDLAVAPPGTDRGDGLEHRRVATLTWSVFARKGHPAIARWNKRQWTRYPHVQIRTASGEASPVEQAARSEHLERRAGPVLPHFMLALPLLSATDSLMTVPTAIVAGLAPRFGLVALRCPIKLAPIELALFWSTLHAADPGTAWFRELALEILPPTFSTPRPRKR